MQFWPGEVFFIENDRTPEENMRRLGAMTQPYKISLISMARNPLRKPFIGIVKGNTFRIFPYVAYRNTSLPVFTGTCARTAGGSRISISMSHAASTKILFSISLAFLAFMEIILLAATLTGRLTGSYYVLAGPLLLGAYAVFLLRFFYKKEAQQAKKRLLGILR